MERGRLSLLPPGAAVRQAAGGLRQLRPALEPLTMDSAAGVVVAIPTLNEAHSIGDVVRGIPRDVAGRIIVADGGSHDATVARAKEAGAEVIHAGCGYGRACLAGTKVGRAAWRERG